MEKIPVTVVIATNNGLSRGFIENALKSVCQQTQFPFEVRLVDDGSSDGTSEYVSKNYPTVKILKLNRVGVSAARNFGCQNVVTEYLCFLDDDDEWRSDKIEKQFQFLEKNKNVGGVSCDVEKIDSKGKTISFERAIQWKFGYPQILAGNPVLGPSTMMLRREVFEAVGGFNENLALAEDYDLWIKISKVSRIGHVPEPLSCYRIHSGQSSSRRIDIEKVTREVIEHYDLKESKKYYLYYIYGRAFRSLMSLELNYSYELWKIVFKNFRLGLFLSRWVWVLLTPVKRLRQKWEKLELYFFKMA